MIRLIDIQKSYDNGTKALKGVNLRIDDGEFVFLVGPSGSGKSTILKLITAEIAPTGGRLMVNGYNLNNIRPRQVPYMRRTLGVIFQDFRLIEKKTVRENLTFAMRAVGASPREIRKRVPYVLELVGLDQKGDRKPNQLSGGEQQRVAIARALVNNPQMIIADEPTGNLDPMRSLEIMMLLERINELGTTVLVVTHAKELVNRFSKRVVAIENGGSSATRRAGITTMRQRYDFGYFLSEGFHSIFTHGFMSFAAVCMIICCLLIMGSFTLVAVNAENMFSDLEAENPHVHRRAHQEEAKALQDDIEAVPNVARAEFMTKEQAQEEFEADYEGNELFDGLPSDVYRDRFHVYLDDISKLTETENAVKEVTGVAKTKSAPEIAEGFTVIRNIAGAVAVILVVILLAVSLFIIANTIKLATFNRREEIDIMKMCGATNAFVRWPFVFEGLILGLVGAVVTFFLQWGIYVLVGSAISGSDTISLITVLPFQPMALRVLGVFVLTGFVIGAGAARCWPSASFCRYNGSGKRRLPWRLTDPFGGRHAPC